jgi:antitoxin component YwqK of YwqJK toxin-antitoxin module
MPTGKPKTKSKAKPKAKEHIQYHKSGTVWARGQMIDGVQTGYWEWFRVDGTRLRSGTFEDGEQVGEWTTYDKAGEVYKVTTMKRKSK